MQQSRDGKVSSKALKFLSVRNFCELIRKRFLEHSSMFRKRKVIFNHNKLEGREKLQESIKIYRLNMKARSETLMRLIRNLETLLGTKKDANEEKDPI